MEAIVKDRNDMEYRKLRKLVLNQASCEKKRKSSKKKEGSKDEEKDGKKSEKEEKKAKKGEKKAKKDGKKSKKEIMRDKLKEKPVINRPLTLWCQRQIAMLKETIVCHRWKAAAKILNALTYETDRTSEIIAMAGFQVFCNHSRSNYELLNQFSNSMARMDKVFHPASILKNVMVLLINGDFVTAKQIIEDETVLKKIFIPKLNEKQKHVFTILKAYKALCKYIDWVTSEEGIGQNDEDDIYSQERQTRLQIHERGSLANNAIEMFEALFQEPGNWDMFVSKYLELMEFCDRKEKAIVTLHNYCKSNPLNPNAYIFFYDFVRKHFKHLRTLLVTTLKKLQLVKPCDRRIFDFPSLLRSTNNCLELESYFNMIDHPQWKNDASAWNIFANRILNLYQFPVRAEFKKLGELWRGRSDWWPEFHFVLKEVKIKSVQRADLFLNKAVVFMSLTNTENEYTKKVRRKLSRHHEKHLVKLDSILELFLKLDTADLDEDEHENKPTDDSAYNTTILDQSAETPEFSGIIAINHHDDNDDETPNSRLVMVSGDGNLNSDTNFIHYDHVFRPENQNGVYCEQFEPGQRLSGCEVTLFHDPLELVQVCHDLSVCTNGDGYSVPQMDVTFASSEEDDVFANLRSSVDDCLEVLKSPVVEKSGRKAKKRRQEEKEVAKGKKGKRKHGNGNETDGSDHEKHRKRKKRDGNEENFVEDDNAVMNKRAKRKEKKRNEDEDDSTQCKLKRRREKEKETNGKENKKRKNGDMKKNLTQEDESFLASICSWQSNFGVEKLKTEPTVDEFVVNSQNDMFDY